MERGFGKSFSSLDGLEVPTLEAQQPVKPSVQPVVEAVVEQPKPAKPAQLAKPAAAKRDVRNMERGFGKSFSSLEGLEVPSFEAQQPVKPSVQPVVEAVVEQPK